MLTMEDKKGPLEEEPVPAAAFVAEEDADAVEEEKRVEYFCGIGKFRPKFLQVFRDAKVFTFFLCCNCFIEGALVSGFTSVILSSIERRYQLSGLQVGLVASVFDMSVLVSVIFISFFGGKGHKPRWLGVSLLIQGLGAFIFALPEWVFGNYSTRNGTDERYEACASEIDFSPDCDIVNNNRYSLVFFYFGNIIIGIGAAALFTIGPSYIDDIVRPKFVSIHLGVFFMWSILGPALGFGLGAGFLAIYVDPWVSIPPGLDPSDPTWVGAWWLGFVFSGLVSWLLAIPFLMFPRLLPNSHLVKAEREKEMAQIYKRDGSKEDANILSKVKSFPYHVGQIFLTPSWIFITIAICFSASVVTGVTAFTPKYYESQFSLTASTASLLAGAIAIPTGAAGVLAGAVIVFLTKSKGRTVALVNWIVTLSVVPFLLVFLARCPTLKLAGVTEPFADGITIDERASPNTFSSCNFLNCNCSSTLFEPVCGVDDVTYFSPCAAGCDKDFVDNDQTRPIFENCTCVGANMLKQQSIALALNLTDDALSFEELVERSPAKVGVCDQSCKSLGIYLAISIIGLFLIFLLQVPNIIITIRCVADEQRTLALGIQSFLFRTFGNVPGPIVFGALFDSACVFFRYECNQVGNCWVYNNSQLSYSFLGVALVGVFANFIFSFLSWIAYPKQNVSGNQALTNKEIPLGDNIGEEVKLSHTT